MAPPLNLKKNKKKHTNDILQHSQPTTALRVCACVSVILSCYTSRAEDVPYRANIRESELPGRTQEVSPLREDCLQRAEPLLRALSREIRVQPLHGRLYPQRYPADALPFQTPGTERVKMVARH